jgi:hypothetical protein
MEIERYLVIYRRDGDVKMTEVKIEVMWPLAEECWQPLEAEKGRSRSFLRASRGKVTLLTL